MAASLKSLELVAGSRELRSRLEENTKYFRSAMTSERRSRSVGDRCKEKSAWARALVPS